MKEKEIELLVNEAHVLQDRLLDIEIIFGIILKVK